MLLSMTATAPAKGEPQATGAELARRAQGGDRDALSALLREHAADIHRLCHHVLGPTEGADGAQRALERIVRRIETFDPAKGSFRSWALTVAHNTCRDRLRRRGLERRTFADDGDEAARHVPLETPGPERLALARLEASALAEALTTLPDAMRSAIVLFHVHGQSYEEIAAALEVPKGTVMTWLHRGRKRLRAALEARG
ncbi:MAG: RNA polymerase subunit sigma-24 [Sandaracinus sp.]|nr:RNA polymerase subunit sigma-24 [Sandaracinus sp.]